MNTPEALERVDRIREAASSEGVSKEDLQALVAESTELVEVAIEAIIHFQVAEELIFTATGIRVPNEIVSLAVETLASGCLKKKTEGMDGEFEG